MFSVGFKPKTENQKHRLMFSDGMKCFILYSFIIHSDVIRATSFISMLLKNPDLFAQQFVGLQHAV